MQFLSIGLASLRRTVSHVVRGTPMAAALIVGLAGVVPHEAMAQVANNGITTGMTCEQFMGMVKSGDQQTLGIAILWLDGVYAGRSGVDAFPPGFAATLAQGAGGNCASSANSARLLIDVIADVHKQSGTKAP